ncbi:XRE family transcriptional regulator [Amycolatopsis rhizosphaerae]|uniref:XRE family transcriptional regulator n=1 Tax=Amycolatopsis rhizosphaerae TaxID=2053003 RepID=A0A558DGH7_9PSEU|nr:helix-turn-helix transcriptional regulator [Amycolatopsis rhizosphaerae]TVT60126.1 XRE family transcriptional regulator [Amycolatopsis rhizosphaerae]
MAEDWAAVARAINERVKELGWRQRELAERSHVSSAIVREIQRNTVNRKRSPRTLESLSVALGWHSQHLEAVLNGRKPPKPEDGPSKQEMEFSARLDALERRLDSITDRLDDMKADLAMVVDYIRSEVQARATERRRS